MPRMMITGAGGFVGRHVMAAFARALTGPDDRLAGIGRGPTPDLPEGTEYCSLDLLDGAGLGAFVAAFRPTHVLHLAGLSSVSQASGSPAATWRVNLVGLLNLCEAVAAGAPGSTFLFVSSGEVYGRAFLSGSALSEAAEPLPANPYARTKRAGEQMLGDILLEAGVHTRVLRPFNHVGRGQDERFVAASFAGQIARIEAGRAPPVLKVGDLSARRDFLDVADVVAAYVALVERGAGLPSGAVFNVCSGQARPIADILDGLRAQARVPFDIAVDPDRLRPSEIPVACGDPSALAAATGWRPRIRWEDTLAAILDDARARLAAAG